MSLELTRNKLPVLKDRALMLHKARSFFLEKNIMEVDCPLLSQRASIDLHIDLVETKEEEFLITSPEYSMKRLLSAGFPDIYCLSHVFRFQENGIKHNQEFMMAEWYRLNKSFDFIVEETVSFIALFLGEIGYERKSYLEIFEEFLSINPFTASKEDLLKIIFEKEIQYEKIEEEEKDELLNLLLGVLIEPFLGNKKLFVLEDYPASQASLAIKEEKLGHTVAKRFEVYFKGIELANGYLELLDSKEQKKRLEEANFERKQRGKKTLPLDERFLEALAEGLPPCVGVAVGFDRLMMLRHQKQTLAEIMCFSSFEA